MKRLKVGLLEIPISTREKLTGMDDIGYYKTPVISFPKTGGLRGELEKKIRKFFKNNGEIEIENDYLYLGERGKELEHEDFIRIGKNFKEMAQDYDFLMVFGEDHSAAYPLYYCRGRALRIDCHGDAFFNREDIKKEYKRYDGALLNYATYMNFVEFDKIKSARYIDNIGVLYGKTFGRNLRINQTDGNYYNIVDIDTDGFDKDYHFQFVHASSYIKIRNLKNLKKQKPKVIGIFEYRENDDRYNNVPKLVYILAKMAISNIINNT